MDTHSHEKHHHTLEVGETFHPRFSRHARFPQHTEATPDTNGFATAVGSCGDSIDVSLLIRNNRIEAIQHVPWGCAYTIACASAMSVLAQGLNIDQALEIQPEDVETELGGLPKDHLHCARLAVNTLGEAIADYYKRRQMVHSSEEPMDQVKRSPTSNIRDDREN